MNKILAIGMMSATLAACTGGGTTSSSSSTLNSSSMGNVSSSASLSSASSIATPSSSPISSSPVNSSPIQSSSTAVASSSSLPALSGNAARGKTAIEQVQCKACHGDEDSDGYFTGLQEFDVDQYKIADGSTLPSLAQYIDDNMPTTLSNVDAQTALDIATYLWLLKDGLVGPSTGPVACDNEAAVRYGQRGLKLLTTYEYGNSLQALFDETLIDNFGTEARVGADVIVGGLPNLRQEKVTESRLNNYDSNANDIARWAVATEGALRFECNEADTCANDFTKEFAYRAFRRPLTQAETDGYLALFKQATDLKIGLTWAIRSVLASPYFLYRSELGQSKQEALAALDAVPEKIQYEAADTPLIIEGEGWRAPTNQGYKFQGNDVVILTLEASQGPDYSTQPVTQVWPTIGLSSELETGEQSFYLKGKGPHKVTFHSTKVGDLYYFNVDVIGSNASVNVISAAFAPAKIKEPPQAYKQKVSATDASAFVLDAYEYASALSYFYTGSSPDDQLLDAAAAGDLFNMEEVEFHIDRIMNSPLGRAQTGRFAGNWFKTDKVIGVTRNGNENFNYDVQASMAQEIREIFNYAFYQEDTKFTDVYRGDFTMLDKTLADYYGLAGGGASAMAFEYVSTQGNPRGGVIASGAYMTANAQPDNSHPIFRASHFRQDMLCQSIPLPVDLSDSAERLEAVNKAEALKEAGEVTMTQYHDLQTNAEGSSCQQCHKAIINPLFAMDDFDHLGFPRKRIGDLVVQKGLGINGKDDLPIDMINNGGKLYGANAFGSIGSLAENEFNAGQGLDFKGAKGLGQAIVDADLPGVHLCLSEKAARWAFGHALSDDVIDTSYEAAMPKQQARELMCIRDDAITAYRANNESPKALFKALGLSDAMRFRR